MGEACPASTGTDRSSSAIPPEHVHGTRISGNGSRVLDSPRSNRLEQKEWVFGIGFACQQDGTRRLRPPGVQENLGDEAGLDEEMRLFLRANRGYSLDLNFHSED